MTAQTINTAFHQRLQGITGAIESLAYEQGDTNNDKKGLADIVTQLEEIVQAIAAIPTGNVYNINISVYILLIIFSFFIPWWLYKDHSDRLTCLLRYLRETPLYTEGLEQINRTNPELLNRFQAIFEVSDSDIVELKEASELSEEEQMWQGRASMIQDLYRDLWQSSTAKPPSSKPQNTLEKVSQKLDTLIQQFPSIPVQPEATEDIKAIRSYMTEVRSQLDQLLRREGTVEPGLEQDIAQLISGDFPQPTQAALSCIRQISLIEDLICEESFDLQKMIETLEDMRQNLVPYLTLLAPDPELQKDYKNAFNPSGWNDSFEVRTQHFLGLQLLRLRILQYFAATEKTGETPT